MSSILTPILTTAGLQAAFSANNSGLSISISHVALGNGAYTPNSAQTALLNEQQRVPIADGRRSSGTQVDLSFIADGDSEYWVREIGFYLDDGTLFAVWSDPDRALAWKSATTPLVLGLELALAQLPADSVNITTSGPPLQLILTPEIATLSAAIIRLQTEQVALHQRIERLEKS